jgi:hypothetical protein
MAKYDPLKGFLLGQSASTIKMTFEDVGRLVGGLPDSAYSRREWWANERDGRHVQAHAWMKAGWSVDAVNLSQRTVTFRRA